MQKPTAPAAANNAPAARYSTSARSFYAKFLTTSKFVPPPPDGSTDEAAGTNPGAPQAQTPVAAPVAAPTPVAAPVVETKIKKPAPVAKPPSKNAPDASNNYHFPTLRNKIPRGAAKERAAMFQQKAEPQPQLPLGKAKAKAEPVKPATSVPPPAVSTTANNANHQLKSKEEPHKPDLTKPLEVENDSHPSPQVSHAKEGRDGSEDEETLLDQLMAEEEALEKEVVALNELLKQSLDETDQLVAELEEADRRNEKLRKKYLSAMELARKLIAAKDAEQKTALEKKFTQIYLTPKKKKKTSS